MIFVDSNIPMYIVGGEHPHKAGALRLLDDLILREKKLVTDVEVLQQILHRYVAIGRIDAIQPAFNAVTDLVDEIFPIDLVDLQEARSIVLGSYGLSARDALHVAVMRRYAITRILSFDAGFDQAPGISRPS